MISPKILSLKSGLIVSAASLVLALPAYAQPSLENAKELGDVLNQFATEANVEILFSPDLVNEHVANAAELSGEPRENLLKILSGTGLSFEEPSPDVFIITEATAPTMPTFPKEQASSETIRTNVQKTAKVQTQTPQTTDTTPASLPNRIDLEAAPGVISGQVTDQFSGQALAGAIVMLEGSGRTTSTDTRGFYRFSAAPVGEYDVTVNYLGSEFQSSRVQVASRQSVKQNFSLGNPLDVLVVYGTRSSLQQALNQQRAASNSATVVSSDLLGDFPSETISEALRRVSGVTFTRDADTGEGERITVRGFNDQAVNIQLNGVDLQGTGIDRGIDLTGFLTDNIKQVTIQKSLLPSMQSSASGGLVEIETRSGLDYGETYLSLAGEWQTPVASGFGDEVELAATGAYQFTPDFGISGTIQYRDSGRTNFNSNTQLSFDSILPEGFTSLFRTPESFDFPFVEGFDDPIYRGASYLRREREEENLTISINAAYDWEDHTRLRLDLQQINSDAVFSTQNATVNFSSAQTDLPVAELDGDIRRRRYFTGLQPSINLLDNAEELTTRTASLRGETDVGQWEFDYKVGYSESERERERGSLSFISSRNSDIEGIIDPATAQFVTDDNTAMTQRLVSSPIRFTGNGFLPNLNSDGFDFLSSQGTYFFNNASQADAVDTSENITYEGDVRRYFASDFLDYIEIGLRYDDRERENSDDVLSTTNLNNSFSFVRNTRSTNTLGTVPLTEFGDFFSPVDFGPTGLDIGLPGLAPGSVRPVIDQLFGILDAEEDLTTDALESRVRLNDNRTTTQQESVSATSPARVQEDIFAAYAEAKVDIGDIEVIGGVRYVKEDYKGRVISAPSYFTGVGFASIPREVFANVGLVEFSEADISRDTWTPSVIANYRPTPETVIRGAYFRSTVNPGVGLIARPTLVRVDLRSTQRLGRITEANPDLSPTVTDNFDLDLSYFFKDNPGLIRIGGFYKKLEDNFTQVASPVEPGDLGVRDRILDILAPLGDTQPNLLDLPEDLEYEIVRPRNGEGGEIYGVELELIRQVDFLGDNVPSWIENFSVLGNLTYTKSDFSEVESALNDEGDRVNLEIPAALIGQSRWAGNASLRYEDGRFSSSVIYTYQSSSPGGFDEFNINAVNQSFDTLDARLSYQFDDLGIGNKLILFVEGDDLLRGSEEGDIRGGFGSEFASGTSDYFFPDTAQFSGGRRVTFGARMTF